MKFELSTLSNDRAYSKAKRKLYPATKRLLDALDAINTSDTGFTGIHVRLTNDPAYLHEKSYIDDEWMICSFMIPDDLDCRPSHWKEENNSIILENIADAIEYASKKHISNQNDLSTVLQEVSNWRINEAQQIGPYNSGKRPPLSPRPQA